MHSADDSTTRDPTPPDTEPDPANGVKVRAHPALCMGNGACHTWAPEVYPLDEDGEIAIHMLAVPAELAVKAWIGASVCPEQAISVIGPPEEYWVRLRDDVS